MNLKNERHETRDRSNKIQHEDVIFYRLASRYDQNSVSTRY